MNRKGFVGLAGAVIVAAVLGQALVGAQGNAAQKAPGKSTDQNQKAAPAQKSNPAAKTPEKSAAPKTGDMSAGSGGAIPAKTPTTQPASGAAEEPKATPAPIGSVHIPKNVMADGKPLPAGTYTLRLTDQMGSPVVGQTASEARWVEFVQGGQVKGREMATVLVNSEAKTIAKQGVPAAGASKIQTLVGNDYLRVWINKGGINYLVHLPNS